MIKFAGVEGDVTATFIFGAGKATLFDTQSSMNHAIRHVHTQNRHGNSLHCALMMYEPSQLMSMKKSLNPPIMQLQEIAGGASAGTGYNKVVAVAGAAVGATGYVTGGYGLGGSADIDWHVKERTELVKLAFQNEGIDSS